MMAIPKFRLRTSNLCLVYLNVGLSTQEVLDELTVKIREWLYRNSPYKDIMPVFKTARLGSFTSDQTTLTVVYLHLHRQFKCTVRRYLDINGRHPNYHSAKNPRVFISNYLDLCSKETLIKQSH